MGVDFSKPAVAATIIAASSGVVGLVAGLVAPYRPGARIGLGLGVAAGTAGLGTVIYFAARTRKLRPGVHAVRVGTDYILDATATGGDFRVHNVATSFEAPGVVETFPAPPDALAFTTTGTLAIGLEARVAVRRPGIARITLELDSGEVLASWTLDANGAAALPESEPAPNGP